MDKNKRKELLNAYKSRQVIGGIYYIKCSGNDRIWLRSTLNMDGSKSRYDFAIKTDGALEPSMLREWNEYGTKSFSFVVLEELKKGKTQTDKEFADDIDTLLEIWTEKYENGELEQN